MESIENQINSVVTKMPMVELSDGTKMPLPRLSNLKVLELVKFAAGDGLIIYDKFMTWREVNTTKTPIMLENNEQKTNEKGEKLFHVKGPSIEDAVGFALEVLPNEKIAKLVAILLDTTVEEAEQMDFFDTSLLIGSFLENTPIEKLTALVKKIQPKFRRPSKEQIQQANNQETEVSTQQTASVTSLPPSPQI